MGRPETLEEFKLRTEGFSKDSIHPDNGWFHALGGSLTAKADEWGRLKPFYGDTMVYLLDAGTLDRLESIQRRLYEGCGHLLAEPLERSTFHITLHSLSDDSCCSEGLCRRMMANRAAVKEILRQPGEDISLRSTWLFNMMNTSVVLGFAPMDEENCMRLMGLYERFQSVVELGSRLTPHVTMAYYKPGSYPEGELDGLRRLIREVEGEDPLYVKLTPQQLVYQRFYSMNCYETL